MMRQKSVRHPHFQASQKRLVTHACTLPSPTIFFIFFCQSDYTLVLHEFLALHYRLSRAFHPTHASAV